MEEIKIRKSDWQDLKKAAEMNIRQALISVKQFQTLFSLCDEELSKLDKEEETEIDKEFEDMQNA